MSNTPPDQASEASPFADLPEPRALLFDLDGTLVDTVQLRIQGFDELNTSPVPLPGARELLAALEESHLTFAIATSSLPGQVAVSVAALRLPSSPPITDGSHVEHAKPEPDLLLESASQLGIPPERCWYVGDSTWDMMAGVRAGMVAIGVTTGAVDSDALLAAGASVAVPSLTALLDELRGRGLVGTLPD